MWLPTLRYTNKLRPSECLWAQFTVEGTLGDSGIDAHMWSEGSHLALITGISPTLDHRGSAAEKGLNLVILLSSVINKQILRHLRLEKSFPVALFLVQLSEFCACAWAEPGFATVLLQFFLAENYSGELLHELLHVCIVLALALKE